MAQVWFDEIQATQTPEPSALILLGTAFVGLLLLRVEEATVRRIECLLRVLPKSVLYGHAKSSRRCCDFRCRSRFHEG